MRMARHRVQVIRLRALKGAVAGPHTVPYKWPAGHIGYAAVSRCGRSSGSGRGSWQISCASPAVQAVSRNSNASGVMSMWNSIPSTLASRDKVASDGS